MKKGTLAVLILLLFSLPLAAQDFQVGARAKGMGGSYSAFEDDPVSIWLNPAGIARQGSKAALHYQTFTQYELEREQTFIGTMGEPETGLTDPPIIPSFAGMIFPLGDDTPYAMAVALVRPFENRLTYDFPAPPAISAQSEQQFWRFRAAFAYDIELFSGPAVLKNLSIGGGVDLGYTRHEFMSYASSGVVIDDISDTNTRVGFGAGFLSTIYDDGETARIVLGGAYQSKINFDLQENEAVFAAWDWPPMVNGGVTIYLAEEVLRITLDAQWVGWDTATKDSEDPASPSYEDALNFSVGVEYQIQVDDSLWVFPRAGYRRYDAPWDDAENLPATSLTKLNIDTSDDTFDIITLGFGIRWRSGEGKFRGFDIGIEVGGDVPNYSIGYTHSF